MVPFRVVYMDSLSDMQMCCTGRCKIITACDLLDSNLHQTDMKIADSPLDLQETYTGAWPKLRPHIKTMHMQQGRGYYFNLLIAVLSFVLRAG